MKRYIHFLILLALLAACSAPIEKAADAVTKRQIRGTLEFFGLDHLEGRAPGTRGGELAEHYVKSVYRLMDIAPYGENYFQEFTLAGFTLQNLSMRAAGIRPAFRDDVVGSYTREEDSFALTGEAVFAGFGIVSDAWDWDDYKDVSVQGKILIVRVNEPGRQNPELFEGDALTYFGRWTYKIEEAARRGARGILLVHTTESAGYGWHVVRNSWGGEELYLPSMLENDLAFRGWIREERLRDILNTRGIDLDALYDRSEKRSFEPVDLGFTVSLRGRNAFRSFQTRNVVGYIPGSHPKHKGRAVLLSAHTDHLGMNPDLPGDQIFNGAIDNGSALTAMIMCADILKSCQEHLKYSVILLACEAEESGLLGSRYFAESIDPASIVANINFESTPVWEEASDFMGIGAKYSDLEDILKDIVRDEGLDYTQFSLSDQGFFYRSDQFSFARRGIPSLWISAGESYAGGTNRLKDFFVGGDYHTVDDEYDPDWDLGSMIQTIRVAVRLVETLNRRRPDLAWKGRMTFPVDKP